MEDLFTIESLLTLCMLILLQAVLGFDNLLYISIESKRVEETQQARVRRLGIGMAIVMRIALLFVLMSAIQYFREPFVKLNIAGIAEGEINVHAAIVLVGGVFIIYTAFKEILHMLSIDDIEHKMEGPRRTVAGAIFWIVVMNLIFSFDSILSAMALTENFIIMAIAIIGSGLMMIWLADHVADFLKRNRMFEVLGLFILFIVGIMLLSEGGHLGHLKFFGYAIEPMAKSTFYFVIVVLVAIDLAQTRYQKKLLAQKDRELATDHA